MKTVQDLAVDLTPAQDKALAALRHATYFQVGNNWKSRGRAIIFGMTADFLIREKLVEEKPYNNGDYFGHMMKITHRGKAVLEMSQVAA